MKKIHGWGKVSRERIIIVVAILVTLGFLVWGAGFGIKITDETNYASNLTLAKIDDQRSTLWPLLVSLVVTMLGSLITTYVFLKEALDRTVDEKPYYSVVINEYRSRTMNSLWHYTIFAFILMGVVIALYSLLYFMHIRTPVIMRRIIIILYGICMVVSVWFLRKCIDIEGGLFSTAEDLIQKRIEESEGILKNVSDAGRKKEVTGENETVAQWLQIEDKDAPGIIDKKKYINKFSEWEKLLLLLIEKGQGFLSEQSMNERINTAIINGGMVFEHKMIEDSDADSNDWNDGAYRAVKEYQEFCESREKFCEIYALLSGFRDLLQVQMETCKGQQKSISAHIGDGSNEIAKLFQIFLIYMSINVFRILPRIKVFLPAEKFEYANFYNTRFENSAFRFSSFEQSVFSRSKMNNSNFGMTLFRKCEFFSIDSRNCSLSNGMFDTCSFKEAIFENVDFTGTHLRNCNLQKAGFNDSILSNLEIENTRFDQNNFTNSKIWNVILKKIPGNEFRGCDFSNSDLHKIILETNESQKVGAVRKKDSEKDSVVREYLECLECMGKSTANDEDIVKKFRLMGPSFYISEVVGGWKQKKSTRAKKIWNRIKNEAAVHMNESVFENTKMPQFRFFRTDLEQCVFSGAQMNALHLLSVDMPGCIMNRANLRESLLWAVNMPSVVLDDSILFKAICKVVNFEDASLRKLHASESQIMYCSFNRSDCSFVDLTKAKIYDTSFRDAILTGAELTGADFKRAAFENGIADKMLSSYSVFRECNMQNAFFARSSFNYTVFDRCDFSMANLSGSTVTNVEFYHCNFRESNFRNTCFINAVFQDIQNLEAEIFEGCKFINPRFEGKNERFEEILLEKNILIT